MRSYLCAFLYLVHPITSASIFFGWLRQRPPPAPLLHSPPWHGTTPLFASIPTRIPFTKDIWILSHFLYHHHCVPLFQWNAFEGMFGVSTALPVVCPSSTEPPNEHMWVMADCPQYIYGPEHHHDHQYQCRPKGKMQKKEGKKLTSVSFSFTLLELIDLFLFYSVQSIFRIFYWELKIHGFGKNFGK